MKKVWILLFIFCLWGCEDKEVVEEVPEVVIEKDEDAYHNIKVYIKNNSIPHIIQTRDEMDDELYGSFIVEVFDSNFEPVWEIKWRDLVKVGEVFAEKPLVFEDKLIVNVEGVVSIHNLLTGEFLWELESDKTATDFAIYDGVLYILYYQDRLVVGIDLETGAEVYELTGSASNIEKIHVDERSMILYYSSMDKNDKNGFEYSLSGEFLRKVHMPDNMVIKTMWDEAESSDEEASAVFCIDGSLETVWIEKVKGYGEKEFIEITKDIPVTVNRLVIYNGDHTSNKNFEENAKLKRAVFSVGDGKSFTYVFDTFEFGEPVVIEFIKPILADYILITIEEAEAGSLYKNTGITELYTE